MRLSSERDRSIPCKHWPPSPPLMPCATCRSERMGIGAHFTSRGRGAPTGLSSTAGMAAGERAANSAMIAITMIEGNDLVLMLTYLPDVWGFGRDGLAFAGISLRKFKKRPKYPRRRTIGDNGEKHFDRCNSSI